MYWSSLRQPQHGSISRQPTVGLSCLKTSLFYLSLRSWCSLLNCSCSLFAMLFTGPTNAASLLIPSSLFETVTCSRSPNSSSSSGEMLVKLSVPVASAAQLSVVVACHAASNVRSKPALCQIHNTNPFNSPSVRPFRRFSMCAPAHLLAKLSSSYEDGGPEVSASAHLLLPRTSHTCASPVVFFTSVRVIVALGVWCLRPTRSDCSCSLAHPDTSLSSNVPACACSDPELTSVQQVVGHCASMQCW